ncbi:TonB-dependent receptor plug domain-containing protein [Parvularcula dongshanensis]|uniref:Outer membrane receptor protein involved in Fe transport n=1 Tax=Parvularcula dongshanensis TaxID=1173995 RepID=A0A840I479_9PROT|nr:TonB-dependent receptor [Parvularcula dongshanensis]MBB4659577.1 outer membrane receptor protein involved in Fe transport [Parvularcula dongshanensis]
MKRTDRPQNQGGRARHKALLLGTVSVLMGTSLVSIAQAQDGTSGTGAQTAPQREANEDTIIVTGSRLAPRGVDAPTPVSVVGEEDFTLSGTQNVENLLFEQPQFSANQLDGPKANTVQAGQPVGISTLNLRNFGPTRNLVLVNGRRFAISGPALTTDVNTIPVALIERTEIVTGGSSAVYGSDAITGVTNFVLRDDFEGVELNGQFTIDSPTSTETYSADLTMGGNFDGGRGNLTASLSYLDRGGFTNADRGDFAVPSYSDGCVTAASYSDERAGVPLAVPAGETCLSAGGRPGLVTGGSSAVPNGRIGNIPAFGTDTEIDAALTALGLQNAAGLGAVFDEGGTSVRPFTDADRYDLGPNTFLVTPQTRWMGNAFGHYDFNDHATGYLELHFSNNKAEVQIAPTNATGNFLIETDNPYLSPDLQNLFGLLDAREEGTTEITRGLLSLTTTPNDGLAIINYNRRFSDLPTRFATSDRSAFRTAVGVRGDIGDASDSFLRDLAYDVYYTYATTSETDVQIGSVSLSRIQNAILSSGDQPPLLNFFGQNISAEAADLIGLTSVSKIEAEQEVIVGTLTGVAFDMPAGPVDFAAGFEWRRAEASYTPDAYLSSGDVSGWNAAEATSGDQSVKELFGEVRVPILADMPWVQRLNVNGAFRYSDYNLEGVGSVWTYSAGAEWALNDDLSFRGQFQHAIRAPNVGELFGGQGTDGPLATDPCSARVSADQQTETLRALCIATGVPADRVFTAGVQPSPFLNQVRGGNPDLSAEESDTVTLGLILEPSAIDGLVLSVDYFDIDLEDAIAPLGGGGIQNVLDLCYNTLQDAGSVYCQAINRDPLSGEIAPPRYVFTTNANIGGIKTKGIDAMLRYGFDTEWGLFDDGSRWQFDSSWTWTDEFVVTPIQELPEIQNSCVGAWGGTCGQPLPEFKGTTRLTWTTGPALLSLRARYLDGVTIDSVVVPRERGETPPDLATLTNPKIDPYVYLDLTGGYEVSDNTRLTVGVRNMLDKDPPVLGSSQLPGSNTIPATYDVQGRVFFVSLNHRF